MTTAPSPCLCTLSNVISDYVEGRRSAILTKAGISILQTEMTKIAYY